jgi:GAF domain-containing protein
MAFSYNAPPEYTALISATPMRSGRGALVPRVLLERRPVHIPDALADKEFTLLEAQRLGGFRSMLGVPMMREGNLIGVIAIWTTEVRPFTDKQIELVSTFADQAVIAIENVRLFNETKESLERQTATAEILKVIASSPSDVQPVFDAIVQTARRLLGGFSASVTRVADDMVLLGAYTGIGESGDSALKGLFPALLSDRPELARVVETKASFCIADAETDPDVTPRWQEMARRRGFRSVLFVPMLRAGRVIGTINVTRREPGPFIGHQVELLKTFADQAVIAIENVRLFNETKERSSGRRRPRRSCKSSEVRRRTRSRCSMRS